MSKASDDFEKLIARTHELLEGDSASVEWNERIPDPDNPTQGRQIDVLVRKNGLVNLIECRLHKVPQDVQWIEELIGRRASLQADAIVAVSASGFTSGAIRKANKYGVILKDLCALTDEEIIAWARSIEISVFYYRYDEFRLSFFFDSDDFDKLDANEMQNELQYYDGFRSLFTAHLELLDKEQLIVKENRHKRVTFRVNFNLEDFQLCGCEVREIQAEGKARLEEIRLTVPEVLAYGEPELEHEERNVYIQNYNLGETKVVHHNGHISISLDLSQLEVPPYRQFRYFTVSSEDEKYLDLLEIIHPEKLIMKVDKIDLDIIGVQV